MAVAHNDIPEVMCWNLIIGCVWWQELPCVSLVTVVYEMLFSLFLQLLIAYVLKGNMARWLGLHFLSEGPRYFRTASRKNGPRIGYTRHSFRSNISWQLLLSQVFGTTQRTSESLYSLDFSFYTNAKARCCRRESLTEIVQSMLSLERRLVTD